METVVITIRSGEDDIDGGTQWELHVFQEGGAEVDSSDVVGAPWNESMQWSSRAQVNLSIIAPIYHLAFERGI